MSTLISDGLEYSVGPGKQGALRTGFALETRQYRENTQRSYRI